LLSLADEIGNQPAGQRGCEQCIDRGHDLDRVDQFGGGGVLE
jgi:hypothetical protein